jgi:hypothetical protein
MRRKLFALAEVKAVDGESPNGEFEVILSAPTLDRDGEVIEAKAFEPLPDHITFDIDHGMSVATTVGSGVPRYDGDLLKVKGGYASTDLAQQVRALVTEGHIRTTSVAFMDAKREVKDGVPHIVKAELLNGAFVAVASNREAEVLVSKAFGGREHERLDAKSIAGSFEHRRDLLREAVRDANPEAWWVGIVATFDDSVVYEVEGMSTGAEQYQASYSIDEAGTVTLGAASAVEVTEVITPAKAASSAEKKSTDTDPEMAAAPAAAAPADVTVAKARAAALRAEAELLLTN